jgi:hypothetical protein
MLLEYRINAPAMEWMWHKANPPRASAGKNFSPVYPALVQPDRMLFETVTTDRESCLRLSRADNLVCLRFQLALTVSVPRPNDHQKDQGW